MTEILLDHKHAVVHKSAIEPGKCSAFQSFAGRKLIVCLSGHGVAANGVSDVLLTPGRSVTIQPHDLYRVKNTGTEILVILETSFDLVV